MERLVGGKISVVCVGGFAAGFAAFGVVYAQICAVYFRQRYSAGHRFIVFTLWRAENPFDSFGRNLFQNSADVLRHAVGRVCRQGRAVCASGRGGNECLGRVV